MWLIHGVNYDEPSGVGCQIFRHTGIPQYWVLERQKCSAKMLRVWSSMNAGFKLLHLRVGTTPPNPEDLHTKICYKNWDCWGFFGNDGNTWAKGIHAYQTCGTKTRNGPKKNRSMLGLLSNDTYQTLVIVSYSFSRIASCYPKRESPMAGLVKKMGIHHDFRGVAGWW
jgi:hypothetical protein